LVESLQHLLAAHACGERQENDEYVRLRRTLLADSELAEVAPSFVRTCRTLQQFWQFIKQRFGRYHERRDFIWGEFRPLFDHLEGRVQSPADAPVSETLEAFDRDSVHRLWQRALERRVEDAGGAITLARTLLETVCKHILDELGTQYDDTADLPRLYRLVREALSLAPSQHEEEVFRQILGGCTSIVEGLGSLRNRLSDSHGRGRGRVRPVARHAELAVNLAGAMATFLVATLEARIAREP
jgi:hypothetical protein